MLYSFKNNKYRKFDYFKRFKNTSIIKIYPIVTSPNNITVATRAELQESQTNEDEDVFSGLSYIVNAEKKLKKEKEEEENKKIDKFMEIDETTEDRIPYHKRIYAAARKGNPLEAEEAIQDMISANLRPGPKSYHGLIFAYVKNNNATGALHAIRRAHASGARPILESYIILIHAFVKEGNIANAEAVMVSLRRTGADVRQGWLMLTRTLFKMNKLEEALTHLAKGRVEKWTPDSNLYEMILKCLVKENKIREAEKEVQKMILDGVLCEAKHVNVLMQHYAEKGELNKIMHLFKKVKKSDVWTYNYVFEGIMKKWKKDESQDQSGAFMSEWAKLEEDPDVRPNFKSYLMLMNVYLMSGKYTLAKKIFLEKRLLSNMENEFKNDLLNITADLLNGLSKANYPSDIYQILTAMTVHSFKLPLNAMKEDENGRTFASSWLVKKMSKNVKMNMELAVNEMTPDVGLVSEQVKEIDGVLIGFCNCAVDEEGYVLSLSKMIIPQLQAELKARGLSPVGVRKDLYERVRISRSTLPIIKDEMKRAAKVKTRRRLIEKRIKEGNSRLEPSGNKESNDSSSNGDGKDEGEEEEVSYRLIDYRRNYISNEQKVEANAINFKEPKSLSQSDSGLATEFDDDDEDDEEKEEKVRMFNNLFGNEEVNINDYGSNFSSQISSTNWSDTQILKSDSKANIVNNSTAGSLAAAAICDKLVSLDSLPTLEDIELIMISVAVERNAASAYSLMQILYSHRLPFKLDIYEDFSEKEKEKQYIKRTKRIFETSIKLCLNLGFSDSALYILRMTEDLKYNIDPVLSGLVNQQILLKKQGNEIEAAVSKDNNSNENDDSDKIVEKKDKELSVVDGDDLDIEDGILVDAEEGSSKEADMDTGINSYSSY